MNNKFVERRTAPRVKAQIAARLRDSEFEITTCASEISSAGVYAQIDRKIEPMTKLELTFMVPVKKRGAGSTKRIKAKGIAVRVEAASVPDNPNNHNVAILFTDISARDRDVIAEFVKGQSKDVTSV